MKLGPPCETRRGLSLFCAGRGSNIAGGTIDGGNVSLQDVMARWYARCIVPVSPCLGFG